jgi:hypothetical protein
MKGVDAGVVGNFSEMEFQSCCRLCKSSGLFSAGLLFESVPFAVRGDKVMIYGTTEPRMAGLTSSQVSCERNTIDIGRLVWRVP